MVVIFLTTAFIIGIYSRIHVLRYIALFWSRLWKPLNLLFMVDQVIQIVTIGITLLLYLIGIWTSAPLNDLFGTDIVGWTFLTCSLTGAGSLFIFSAFMAIARVIYFKCHGSFFQRIGEIKLGLNLITVCLVVIISCVWVWVSENSGNMALLNFASGTSSRYIEILGCYEGHCGNLHTQSRFKQRMVSMFLIILNVAEMVSYAVIAYDIYKQNKYTMKNLISEVEFKKRSRKNTQTFISQMVTFGIEQLLVWTVILITFIPSVKPFVLPIIVVIEFAIHPLPGIFFSPDLKKQFLAPFKREKKD